MNGNFDVLCKALQYRFHQPQLLNSALTHRSATGDNNERLEFLGDAALNFIIAAELFQRYFKLPEGDLSRLRATLVNKEFLAKLAQQLKLGDYLILGPGELKSGGHRRNSILADALEAIFGAVYLDSDFDTCQALVLRLYEYALQHLPDIDSLKDAKTRLQEFLQARHWGLPMYRLTAVEGKPHRQIFTVSCRLEAGQAVTEGGGGSRRKAEQQAAERMLQQLCDKAES